MAEINNHIRPYDPDRSDSPHARTIGLSLHSRRPLKHPTSGEAFLDSSECAGLLALEARPESFMPWGRSGASKEANKKKY